MSTIIKKIIDGDLPSEKVYEDDLCVAFKDIEPAAPIHILVVPRKEIPSLAKASPQDKALLGHILLKTAEIARIVGIEDEGYRVVTNINKNGGQQIYHLHFHLLGGEKLAGLNSR